MPNVILAALETLYLPAFSAECNDVQMAVNSS